MMGLKDEYYFQKLQEELTQKIENKMRKGLKAVASKMGGLKNQKLDKKAEKHYRRGSKKVA